MKFCMTVASRPPHDTGQLMAAHHGPAVGVVLVTDLARRLELGQVVVEPGAQLLPEGLVLLGEREVHGLQRPSTSGFTTWRGVAPARSRQRSSAMVWVWLDSVS